MKIQRRHFFQLPLLAPLLGAKRTDDITLEKPEVIFVKKMWKPADDTFRLGGETLRNYHVPYLSQRTNKISACPIVARMKGGDEEIIAESFPPGFRTSGPDFVRIEHKAWVGSPERTEYKGWMLEFQSYSHFCGHCCSRWLY